MFADPAVLTVNGSGKSLIKVNQDKYSSEYRLRSATELYSLFIRTTTYTKKNGVMTERHNIEFSHTVFAVAPSVLPVVRKCYLVLENEQGDTLADPIYEASALCTFLTASTNANLTKMLNGES